MKKLAQALIAFLAVAVFPAPLLAQGALFPQFDGFEHGSLSGSWRVMTTGTGAGFVTSLFGPPKTDVGQLVLAGQGGHG